MSKKNMNQKENRQDKALWIGFAIVLVVLIGSVVMGFVSRVWLRERRERLSDESSSTITEDDDESQYGYGYDDYVKDREYYKWKFDEAREDKTGEVYIHIESVDNEDDAIMIRIKGRNFYAMERRYNTITGDNENVAMTDSARLSTKRELLDFLDTALGAVGEYDYYDFYFDSAESTQGLMAAQQRDLYRYCKVLSDYVRGRIDHATYDARREQIIRKYDLRK